MGRRGEGREEAEEVDFPSTNSLSKCSQPGLGQAKAGRKEGITQSDTST